MSAEINLFSQHCGSVTAPAGCGKTQLIADSLKGFTRQKPILILTHTNAGVSALRARLLKNKVPNSAYRIGTLDGFAMRIIGRFPKRSKLNPRILELESPKTDYPAIRETARALLQSGHLTDVLQASYAGILVDEYQDCLQIQHYMLTWAAQVLPISVLGDPMQAIFGFAGKLVDWQSEVIGFYPQLGTLATPWRWILASSPSLGTWLLDARIKLQTGQGIDLRTAPPEVTWVQLNAANADEQRRMAARSKPANNGTVLIIGDSTSPQSQQAVCSKTPGATVVESVELRDLVKFGRSFNPLAPNSLNTLVDYAATLMTGVVPSALYPRIASIHNNRNQTPPTPAESRAVEFARTPTLGGAIKLLEAFSTQSGTHVYRPEVLRCSLHAMNMALDGSTTFASACTQVRERNRYLSRSVSKRAVGSTLLLKGLESDMVVVLQPEKMSAQDLYVAISRGARQLVICSEHPILKPPAPT
ncbi:UvrD-helicase domain-containing protein [Herbaspirillum seropedicae]|uniref:UvrD-helicase domain-containing protein n=1 Tax=Herbaspirillum seropedicae TaxID=964 RepID=UPI00285D60CA|nr:UvrD-helicase domain-containing protein [Herbaspirillum seropedicae]MDR6397466.1 DNA helicase-2/ATP-dependent DNA helicase PcrA [Herbaspirillum seropedicae]